MSLPIASITLDPTSLSTLLVGILSSLGLTAALASAVTQVIKRHVVPALDQQSPLVKRVLLLVVSAALTRLATTYGVTLPAGIDGISAELVGTILVALGAHFLHPLITRLQVRVDGQA